MLGKKRRFLGIRWVAPAILVLWVVISIVILVCVDGDGSWLFFLPLSIGPVAGMYWVFSWAYELTLALRRNFVFSVFFAFFLTPLGYILLSLLFAAGYLAAMKLGSQIVSEKGACIRDFWSVVYFSIVTGSTLGYGDIVPTGKARVLACIQVMEFWLFLGVAFLYLQSGIYLQRKRLQDFLEE